MNSLGGIEEIILKQSDDENKQKVKKRRKKKKGEKTNDYDKLDISFRDEEKSKIMENFDELKKEEDEIPKSTKSIIIKVRSNNKKPDDNGKPKKDLKSKEGRKKINMNLDSTQKSNDKSIVVSVLKTITKNPSPLGKKDNIKKESKVAKEVAESPKKRKEIRKTQKKKKTDNKNEPKRGASLSAPNLPTPSRMIPVKTNMKTKSTMVIIPKNSDKICPAKSVSTNVIKAPNIKPKVIQTNDKQSNRKK
uniref:Uncharacterized protein n=1 Tax=Parastrongyloides trichosuri TaxID=131310 RepID=A0A0N4ZFF6_PARTI